MSYPSERLAEEVAFLSHYLHWTYDEIMSMDHRERQGWVQEVSRMNERLNDFGSRGR